MTYAAIMILDNVFIYILDMNKVLLKSLLFF